MDPYDVIAFKCIPCRFTIHIHERMHMSILKESCASACVSAERRSCKLFVSSHLVKRLFMHLHLFLLIVKGALRVYCCSFCQRLHTVLSLNVKVGLEKVVSNLNVGSVQVLCGYHAYPGAGPQGCRKSHVQQRCQICDGAQWVGDE